MKVHNIIIKHKYFEPIREGKINLLIFKKKVISDEKAGDFILANQGIYEVKAKITRTYMKAFFDITDDEAQRAGFLNADFLKDELINEYDLKPIYHYDTGNDIDKELFFLVELETNEEDHHKINNPVKVNLYAKNFDKNFYSSEIAKQVREYYDKKI